MRSSNYLAAKKGSIITVLPCEKEDSVFLGTESPKSSIAKGFIRINPSRRVTSTINMASYWTEDQSPKQSKTIQANNLRASQLPKPLSIIVEDDKLAFPSMLPITPSKYKGQEEVVFR